MAMNVIGRLIEERLVVVGRRWVSDTLSPAYVRLVR